MSQLELELGLEQSRGRRLHNRSSGCKGSGASGSGITDTSRFFAYSWIHWIRPFLLIKTPTHLPRASHSTIPCKAGPWDLVPEPWRKTFPHPSVSHPLFCAIMFNASSLVLCALQNQAVTSCTGERNDYEPRVKFSVPLLFTKLCLTFLIRLRTISSTDRVVTWKIV